MTDKSPLDMTGDELRKAYFALRGWPGVPGRNDAWVQPCMECDRPAVCDDPESWAVCDDAECQTSHNEWVASRVLRRDPVEVYGTPEHEAWLIEMEQREG